MADKKDIIYRFAKMLRQMLGDRLTKVILYVLMQEAIITKTPILILWF